MLNFKSTLFAVFIFLVVSGFNFSSAQDLSTQEDTLIPEDYSAYEAELQYLEKLQENEVEKEVMAQMVTDSVSEKAAAPAKEDEITIPAVIPEVNPKEVTPTTNPEKPRRIRSR